MDHPLLILLAIVAALSALPGMLTASILRRHAREAGAEASEWIPFGLLPWAIREFRHPARGAILFGYVATNLIFGAAVVGIAVLVLSNR